jgi:hypothetical protein
MEALEEEVCQVLQAVVRDRLALALALGREGSTGQPRRVAICDRLLQVGAVQQQQAMGVEQVQELEQRGMARRVVAAALPDLFFYWEGRKVK